MDQNLLYAFLGLLPLEQRGSDMLEQPQTSSLQGALDFLFDYTTWIEFGSLTSFILPLSHSDVNTNFWSTQLYLYQSCCKLWWARLKPAGLGQNRPV